MVREQASCVGLKYVDNTSEKGKHECGEGASILCRIEIFPSTRRYQKPYLVVREQASCVGLKCLQKKPKCSLICVVREQASCVGLKSRDSDIPYHYRKGGEGASILCRIEIFSASIWRISLEKW